MVRPDGWVGPAAAVRAGGIQAVTSFALTDLTSEGAEKVRAGVTARCEGVRRAFWAAGLVYQATPGLLLASRPFGRLGRYLPAGYGVL
jgi:hypothetical protein